MNNGEAFWKDSKTRALIDQLVAHLQDTIAKIDQPKPGTAESGLHEIVTQFSENRGGQLFYPYIGSGLGNGALVELVDGSVKIDFISGIGAHFGHHHPALIRSMIKASLEDVVMQGNLQQNQISVELVQKLKAISGMDHVFLTTSGAMAAENALKLILQRRHPAKRLLAFENCFIGRTLSLSQISDKPKNRVGLWTNIQIDYVPFYDANAHDQSIKVACDRLNQFLNRYPDQYAGMCIELIQGEGGFYPGHTEFFEAIMSILKAHQIAVYVDEIQTFGRTSAFFAYQHFGLDKWVDVVTIGKLSQVCATLFRTAYKPKPSTLSQTFTSSTSALYAGLTVLETLELENHFGPEGRNMQMRHIMVDQLTRLHQQYPDWINGPYGEGLMIAFTYKDGSKEAALSLIRTLFKNGLIAFISGANPTRIRFLLPVGSVDEEAITNGIRILQQTLEELR